MREYTRFCIFATQNLHSKLQNITQLFVYKLRGFCSSFVSDVRVDVLCHSDGGMP